MPYFPRGENYVIFTDALHVIAPPDLTTSPIHYSHCYLYIYVLAPQHVPRFPVLTVSSSIYFRVVVLLTTT